jgi:membrane-associated phospholipid phosphatase
MLTLQSAPPPPTEPSLETRWPDDKPFSRFVQNLGHDLVALPSLNTALVIGAGGLGAYSVRGKDDDLANWAAESEPSFSILGDVFGDGWMQGGLATIAYVTGRVNHDAKTTHVASDLIRAQVLNGVLTTTLKVAVNRERPNGGNHSFPSGHTSATFASAAVLNEHFGWKIGVPGYAVGSLIAWSRVRDRSHWLSDTVFGAAVGLAAGQTVTAGHRARTRWTVVPTATKKSVAFYIIRR